jgi:hypothetical protein
MIFVEVVAGGEAGMGPWAVYTVVHMLTVVMGLLVWGRM